MLLSGNFLLTSIIRLIFCTLIYVFSEFTFLYTTTADFVAKYIFAVSIFISRVMGRFFTDVHGAKRNQP